jgi:nucleoside-diphosphate-sugar epimerase
MERCSTILVTGGTGLVGAHLLYTLCESEQTVRAIYRPNSDLEKVRQVFKYYKNEALFDKVEWIMADLLDIPQLNKAMQGVTQVYHCAAVVSFRKKDDDIMYKTNVEGTANMVNLSLNHKVDKFCYVSSIATLEKSPNNDVITEQSYWSSEYNNYGYSVSKNGGELEVWRGSQEGLNVVIVNPGVILGSGFWGANTGKFFSNAAKNFKFYTKGTTGFVGVWDVVKAMKLLMNSHLTNERYILVSENKSFQEVLTSIALHMKTKPPYIEVKPWMSEIAWRVNLLITTLFKTTPLITKQSARSAHNQHVYSTKKIKIENLITFDPLDSVIKHCVTDFKSMNFI